MAAGLPKPSLDENISTTLSSGITDVAGSMDVADASKIVSPCYLVIDRVDSAGTLKATSLWEYVKVTNVSSNTLTITRAQGGSTGQAHGSGAVVEAVITGSMFEDWYTVLNPEHTASGEHAISTASIGTLHTLNGLLAPSWYIPSLPSNATTGLGRPAAMPRGGTWNFINVTLNANISQPTVFFNVKKNFVSIFDTIGRPMIAGGTFVSTASIKTPTFSGGDVFNVDYEVIDLGGNNVDAIVTLVAQ